MHIGIMGGTLDPVHNGHLDLARAARQELALDTVWLLPAGNPPHKRYSTNPADRLEMARLAAAECEWLEVSGLEIERAGTTYTVDTLERLHVLRPEVRWTYIVGADTVKVMDTWRNFPRVAQLCSFAAAERPGCDEAEARACAEQLRLRYGADIRFLHASGPDISSTAVRQRVAENRSIEDAVPVGVADYIRTHGLYLCRYSEAQILEMLQARLKPGRYLHTLGVADTARRLAPRYGVDPMRAYLAGLLHDCAKYMPFEEMVSLVRGRVADADAEELTTEPVLHAPAGMVAAQDEFGVCDPEILSSIRKHTLGGGDMSPMEALIYVADFIEPGRKPFPGLERARSLAETDLFAAAKECARLTTEYVVRQGGKPNSRTAAMLK